MSLDTLENDLQKLDYLVNLIIDRVTGGNPSEVEYIQLRRHFVIDSNFVQYLPSWLVTHRSLNSLWGYIRNNYSTYDARRGFIFSSFDITFNYLEGLDALSDPSEDITKNLSPLENSTKKPLSLEGISNAPLKKMVSKDIFISHSSMDAALVEEIIYLLENIGVESERIFCTSLEGYGIGLGTNFLDAIKSELPSVKIVMFVITENFYNSPICMCEMGAAWVLSKQNIPVIVPPLKYSNINGVIQNTQGMIITDKGKLNSLKNKIEAELNINKVSDFNLWEKKRDRFIESINHIIGQ